MTGPGIVKSEKQNAGNRQRWPRHDAIRATVPLADAFEGFERVEQTRFCVPIKKGAVLADIEHEAHAAPVSDRAQRGRLQRVGIAHRGLFKVSARGGEVHCSPSVVAQSAGRSFPVAETGRISSRKKPPSTLSEPSPVSASPAPSGGFLHFGHSRHLILGPNTSPILFDSGRPDGAALLHLRQRLPDLFQQRFHFSRLLLSRFRRHPVHVTAVPLAAGSASTSAVDMADLLTLERRCLTRLLRALRARGASGCLVHQRDLAEVHEIDRRDF